MSKAGGRYSEHSPCVRSLAPAPGLLLALEPPSPRLAQTAAPPAAGWHRTPAHQTAYHQLEVAFWFTEQDGTVKSVIFMSQSKISTPPPPQPARPSRGPRTPHPHPDAAWPGSRAKFCLCHPRALNGLPVCQSKQDPRGWGRRLRGPRRRTGDFFSLDVPLGRPCQGLCQGICQGVQSAPTLWIHH